MVGKRVGKNGPAPVLALLGGNHPLLTNSFGRLNWMVMLRFSANLARKLAVRYDSVQIVCGPIFVSKTPETIGPNRVQIPDSFFKAFLVKHQDAYHTIAFICPNNPDSVTVVGTARSVNTVESLTGYDFFGFLDDDVEETVENEVEVGRWVR